MKSVAKILAPLSLVATVVPPLLFMLRAMSEGPMKAIMLGATVLWFVTAPFWLKGGAD
jgi:hypothetical protein